MSGQPSGFVFSGPRDDKAVAAETRARLAGQLGAVALPGRGRTAERWSALAAVGAADLCVARLAEGHLDAVAILAEAGRTSRPGALYGVWASRSRGAGARLEPAGRDWVLRGRVPFCSGAGHVERALVAAAAPGGDRLVEVATGRGGVTPLEGTWQPVGMDASRSLDVEFDEVAVGSADLVGPPGFYTGRCGFAFGGGGVAAVWLGGAAAAWAAAAEELKRAAGSDPAAADPHRLAHLGRLDAGLAAGWALMREVAAAIDADPLGDHSLPVAVLRTVAEAVAREAVDLVPRITGPAPLCREPALGRHLADLAVYIRQHHGEADVAAIGRAAISRR